MLLHEVLEHACEVHASRVAFETPEHRVTFEEFGSRVVLLAGGLEDLGVSRGDRVSILAPNCMDYLACHYACARIGAILHVLNTRHTVTELVYAMNDAETAVCVVHPDFSSQLQQLRDGCTSMRFCIGIGPVAGCEYEIEQLIARQCSPAPTPELTPADPVLLIYTSGTTGRPKGALQTHRGTVLMDALTADVFEATADDVFLAFMPYFHQAGLVRSRAILSRGGRTVFADISSPERVASALSKFDVTITMLVPPYDLAVISQALDRGITYPHLRKVAAAAGGDAARMGKLRAFAQANHCEFLSGYGQTEVSGAVVVCSGVDFFTRQHSCGKALPGIDLAIWDDSGMVLPAGEVGEIMIRSDSCIPGYWRNEQATRELYSGEWLHTGDLASIDADNFVYFSGRKKDLIKTGGENVYPREVELAVIEHPQVQDVVVFGLPDPQGWGEMVVAAIVVANSGDTASALTANELALFLRGKIAGYKMPKRIALTPLIPRSFTAKPVRSELVKLFE